MIGVQENIQRGESKAIISLNPYKGIIEPSPHPSQVAYDLGIPRIDLPLPLG